MPLPDPPWRLLDIGRPDALFDEARRQLNICNSCRYCEGYCAVYPALERRTELSDGDIAFLAHLCHDCRACLYACMYAPPHEFGVNPPEILAKVRMATYRPETATATETATETEAEPAMVSTDETIGTGSHISDSRRRGRVVLRSLVVSCIVGATAATIGTDHGFVSLYGRVEPSGSPYAVASFAAIVSLSFALVGLAVLTVLADAVAFYRSVTGSLAGLVDLRAWSRALHKAATLEYLRGGAEGCYVRPEHASRERRIAHHLVAYGFLLCLVSTLSAAVEQDIMGLRPPFPLLSVPVIAGVVGGAGLVLGAGALLGLKGRQDRLGVDGAMSAMDLGFIAALLGLGVTGLATLIVRSTTAYGSVLAIHLALVWACFAFAPFSKFVHLVYRLLALVMDGHEQREVG